MQDLFEIQCCDTGDQALAAMTTFRPDILVIDCMLPGVDALTVLRTIRCAGFSTGVIALTSYYDEVVGKILDDLRVFRVFRKPCRLMVVGTTIRDLHMAQCVGTDGAWCVENEIDRILMSLGFRMGAKRYRCVFHAVLHMYLNRCAMKELYIDVASVCGGTRERVEKAVRDAVEAAYKSGNEQEWKMYFNPSTKNKDHGHPSNEEFITRIAGALTARARLSEGAVLMKQE